MDKVNRRTGSLGSSHFYYDPDTGRIKFRGVQHIMRKVYPTELEYFENNLLRYSKTTLDEVIRGVDRRYGIGTDETDTSKEQAEAAPRFDY